VWLKEQGKLNRDATFLGKWKAPFTNRFNDAPSHSAVTELVVSYFGFTNVAPVRDLKTYIDGTFKLGCSLELGFVAAAHASVLGLNQFAKLSCIDAIFPAFVRIWLVVVNHQERVG
jgi:hypothetical protein